MGFLGSSTSSFGSALSIQSSSLIFGSHPRVPLIQLMCASVTLASPKRGGIYSILSEIIFSISLIE